MKDKSIYVLGDIHGNWKPLQYTIEEYDIRECIIISVGDLGIGFGSKQAQTNKIQAVNELFAERDIQFLGIRGNHDDPAYFDGSFKLSNFELLKDYTVRKLGGRTFQFVGGAISVDRQYRKEGISYWADEVFIFDPEKVEKCDVLITHSAPSWNGPTDKDPIADFLRSDITMWSELKTERADHDDLLTECAPTRHYCGHFHLNSTTQHNGCTSRILDINELLDITNS